MATMMSEKENAVHPKRLRKTEYAPPGTVRLPDAEVLEMQRNLMKTLPTSKVWPFSFGPAVIGASSMVSAAASVLIYRQKFRLGRYGAFATFVPVLGITAMGGTILHQLAITNTVQLGLWNCPLCIQVRSGLLHGGFTSLYSIGFGALVCLPVARRYHTYVVPPFKEGMEMVKLLKISQSNKTVLLACMLANIAVGMFLAGKEMDTFLHVILPKLEEPKDTDIDGEGY